MSDPFLPAAPARVSHRHIEVFRALMLSGSATGAAEMLSTSQPTISRELLRLEQQLGYALFERIKGRLRPSARALQLWTEVQRSWQGLDRVVERALALGQPQEMELNVLCLPALSHALLPGAAARLAGRYPQLRLTVTPQESPLLEEWIAAQRFDLGLSEQGEAPAGTRGEALLCMDEVVVLPAGHRLAAKERLEAADFEGQGFVSLASEDPYRRQIDAVFAAAGVSRTLRLQTHNAVAVCAMVQQGLGLAIVNPLTALACAGPRLVVRPLGFSIPFRVQMLVPTYRSLAPEVALLRAALIEEVGALAARL